MSKDVRKSYVAPVASRSSSSVSAVRLRSSSSAAIESHDGCEARYKSHRKEEKIGVPRAFFSSDDFQFNSDVLKILSDAQQFGNPFLQSILSILKIYIDENRLENQEKTNRLINIARVSLLRVENKSRIAF